MELTFSELKKRDVISLSDGKNLGHIVDLSLALPKGILTGIFVPSKKYFLCFHSKDKLFIPERKIKKIGADVILVDLREEKPLPCPPPCNPCAPNQTNIEINNIDIREYE
ncbi:MAG: YlmC/YmxH family sporulation protein [Clostridiales bacterium]|nr:YlmC/YmxH family sporulation protein [Clostridiales bacterium]